MNVQPVPDLPEFATGSTPPLHPDRTARPAGRAAVRQCGLRTERATPAEFGQWLSRHPGKLQPLVLQVPRFDFERDASAALKLLRRRGLTMPVLLDADWDGWRRFGVSARPTLVLLDAQGRSSNG